MSEKKREKAAYWGVLSSLAYPPPCLSLSPLSSFSLLIHSPFLYSFLLQLPLSPKRKGCCFTSTFYQKEDRRRSRREQVGMDEIAHSPEPDSEVSKDIRPEGQASKRRKVVHEKTVVEVKIGANVGKQKSEGPPSDFWSWRKYGQKPIKGSPYPSTSKGCSAKKQVERSKTDSSVLIITYTSSHNHPGPDISTNSLTQSPPKEPKNEQEQEQEQNQEQEEEEAKIEDQCGTKSEHEDVAACHEDHFHYIESPIRCSQEIMIDQEEDPSFTGFLLDEEPLSCSHLMNFTAPKSEENYDFFDELEELPTFSSFPGFMRSHLSFETIPSVPS